MTYKTINNALFSVALFLIACKASNQNILVPVIKYNSEVIIGRNYKYDSDFPPKKEIDNKGFGTGFVEEWFKEGGVRFGKTGINDSKEGKWLSGDAGFDENGNVYAKGKIWRQEYFKNGLRDSI